MQADGYKYEVIGGQHQLMACKQVLQEHPDYTILKTRRCQVYKGEGLSYQAKVYLGARNNKIAETRRPDTPLEQVRNLEPISNNHFSFAK